jgi:hypothetical protein
MLRKIEQVSKKNQLGVVKYKSDMNWMGLSSNARIQSRV